MRMHSIDDVLHCTSIRLQQLHVCIIVPGNEAAVSHRAKHRPAIEPVAHAARNQQRVQRGEKLIEEVGDGEGHGREGRVRGR